MQQTESRVNPSLPLILSPEPSTPGSNVHSRRRRCTVGEACVRVSSFLQLAVLVYIVSCEILHNQKA